MFNRFPLLMFGLYLGFIFAGIAFTALYVFSPPPSKTYMWMSFTDTVKPAAIEKMISDALAKGHRYLGRDGIDLIWGFNPKNIYRKDVRLPFGLFLIPILIGSITTLVYVAVVRCRCLFLNSVLPNTPPAPSEIS